MKITNIIFCLSAVISLAACGSDSDSIVPTPSTDKIMTRVELSTVPFAMELEDSVDENSSSVTRSTAIGGSTSYQSAYVYNDSVGIFPEGGSQIPFRLPIGEHDDPSPSATIMAEGWDTKVGTLYAVYHPFVFENRSGSHIPFDLRVIQEQTANDNRTSMGKYWTMAAEPVTATMQDDGTSLFRATLIVMESVVRVRCIVPAHATYVRAMLVASSPVFATHGYYDLFDRSGQYVDMVNASRTTIPIPMTYQPKHVAEGDYTDHITLDLDNVERDPGNSTNRYLVCYFLVPEANIEATELSLYLWDSDGNIYKASRTLTGTQGYFSRSSFSNISFTSVTFTQIPSLDVKINDWEKEELCPTCTPVAW